MSPRKFRLVVVPVLVAGLALSACSKAAVAPAATIGTHQVTDAEVAKEAALFMFLSTMSQGQCGTQDPNETAASACNRFALSDLIRSSLVSNYATQHNVTVAEADITKTIQGMDTSATAAKVDQALASNALNRTDLAGLVREALLYQAVGTDITKNQVGDAELHQTYNQQILAFTTIDAEHILLKTKAEADQAYAQVTAPGANEKTFLALAKKISIDPTAKQNSGALGSVPASKYVAEFANAAVALKPGQISKPVHSQYGWHVIRLVSKTVTPYTQAVPQLIQSRTQSVFNSWLVTQAQAEKISVNPKYGVYNAKTLSVDRISSTNPTTASPAPPASATP
jgi:foldase protein PrsA